MDFFFEKIAISFIAFFDSLTSFEIQTVNRKFERKKERRGCWDMWGGKKFKVKTAFLVSTLHSEVR